MDFDTFKAEIRTLKRAEDFLAAGSPDSSDVHQEFEDLCKNYKKLLKIARRLVNMSDRNEVRLKEANTKITLQQQELETAHKELSNHANLLESKVKERTGELLAARDKLAKLVELGIALSMETNHAKFLEMIVRGEKQLTNADGGILFLRTENDELLYEIFRFDTLDLRLGGLSDRPIPYPPIPLRDTDGKPRFFDPIAHAVLTGRTVNIPNIHENRDFDFSTIREFDTNHDYRSQSFLAVPLKPNKDTVIGTLVLINARMPGTGHVISFSEKSEGFIEALASQAAVAMNNQNLIKAQTDLFDSIIKVIAGAIDTKSPYTGGHCARVPEIGLMLARAAVESDEKPFDDFDMNDNEWREFHLASWLHDCGKVTTPECVVDKATKLETVYNRIHEIRMRFEVLYRDHRIDLLEQALGDNRSREEIQALAAARLEELRTEFAFIGQCNIGGEFMDESRLRHLDQLAAMTWTRYFDDRQGLSNMELERLSKELPVPLPAREKLLEDKQTHTIPRKDNDGLPDNVKHLDLNMAPPRYLRNDGELYNLRIARGTLNDAERYKIMEHSINTISMLRRLPFPKQLARVPEIAGAHHETMNGTGYPKGLTKEQLPMQARILAIADIFEALTASDRPYKKSKTLHEAIEIMSSMVKDKRLDPDLFALFLKKGIHEHFAEHFLRPDQRDRVNIEEYVV